MATVPASSTMPTDRQPRPSFGLRRAAPLALGIEAILLGGALALLTHKAPPPPPPAVTTLTLAATPAPAPKAPEPAPPKPAPAVKPTPVAKPVVHPPPRPPVPVRHVSPPPRPATPPPPVPAPSPEPTPPAAAPNTPATDAPAPPPPPQPPAPPAPAAGAADASFDATLRAAIEAALRYPESARMAGITGRVRVAFTYRDGSVSDVRVVVSSGRALLDRAALAAVSSAEYPKPAPGLAGKSLSKQLWVTFDLNDEQ
jgi:periplasmic protein TonB